MIKLRRLIRWGDRYGMNIAAKVGMNQGVSVQIFPELNDFPVANPEHMRPFAVEPTSGWHQAAGRMAQHSHEIWGADNFSWRDGLEPHMSGERFEIFFGCRKTFAFATPREERRVRVGKPINIWIACGEDRLKITAFERVIVRISTQAGHCFRFEGGRASDLKPDTIPK